MSSQPNPYLLKPTETAKQPQIVYTAGKVGKSHHQYLKVMNQQQQASVFRPISAEQLSKHKSKESAWCSLNGTVYDVTTYLNYHPGGSILLDGCGIECTDLFNQHHPWVNWKYLLDKYRIGYLTK